MAATTVRSPDTTTTTSPALCSPTHNNNNKIRNNSSGSGQVSSSSSSSSSITPSPLTSNFHFPSPARRARGRCISCSEAGQFSLDLSLDDDISLLVPDVIVTKRNRTESVCQRIEDYVELGTVKYFCRSRGHGFVVRNKDPTQELFMHISDIEGEYVPRKGDQVSFRLCPIPPRFERVQAVHVHIVNFVPGIHRRWETPETPEELEEDNQIKSLPYDV